MEISSSRPPLTETEATPEERSKYDTTLSSTMEFSSSRGRSAETYTCMVGSAFMLSFMTMGCEQVSGR